MTKPTVLLYYPFFEDLVARHLRPHANVLIAGSGASLKKQLRSADALLTLVTTPVDSTLLHQAPRVRVIGNYGVGVNNIDFEACRAHNVKVCNTPGVLTQSTAELAMALLLAVARRIPEGESVCRANRFQGVLPDTLLGLQLQGRRATLVGQGRIGKKMGQLLRAFGVQVQFITREDSPPQVRRKLREAEILSLHCPLTSATTHWLNKDRLALLPPQAMVVNTARGPVIDEVALIEALRQGRLWGAGLDVYEQEPKIPLALRKLKNVVLLPHIGSATHESRRAMATLVMKGIVALLNGKSPSNRVQF